MGNETGKNEGEGNRTAARAYDKHVQETVKTGNVEKKAREAEAALEGEEGETLQRAEEAGKSHSHGEDPALNKKD